MQNEDPRPSSYTLKGDWYKKITPTEPDQGYFYWVSGFGNSYRFYVVVKGCNWYCALRLPTSLLSSKELIQLSDKLVAGRKLDTIL